MNAVRLVAATTTLAQAARTRWDVAVVGAGPAGALAARQLARRGAAVLLVDRESFPRRKVCGCCLNGSALTMLDACGLEDFPGKLAGPRLRQMRLATGGRVATLPLPSGVALSREAFDAALVVEAIRAGAAFLPDTRATLGPNATGARRVRLRAADLEIQIEARVAVAADGLGGRFLHGQNELSVAVARDARVGGGCILSEAPPFYRVGTIFMGCGRGGYVGLVRLEDERLNVAAAFDVSHVRSYGGLAPAAAAVLAEAGFPEIADLTEVKWRGTPPLTRRRARLSAERVFVIGDAAGYIEPFTGEGMAWALATGLAVTPFVLAALHDWQAALTDQWSERYRGLLRSRQIGCRVLTRILRRPRLTRLAVGALARFPSLARSYIRKVNAGAVLESSSTA